MKRKDAVVQVMQPKLDEESIAALMRKVLIQIGEDPSREGLVRTPDRAEKAGPNRPPDHMRSGTPASIRDEPQTTKHSSTSKYSRWTAVRVQLDEPDP